MIIHQFKAKAFSGALNYVLHKPGARVLGSNTFCRSTSTEINQAMQSVAQQSQRTKRPLMHYAISLAPGEYLSDHQWRSLAREYLKRMGYDNNQYVLVKHTDTPHHSHVHLLVNRVRLRGTTVAIDWDYYQSQCVVRELEKQYNLTRIRTSWEPYQKREPLDPHLPLPQLPKPAQQRLAIQAQLKHHLNEALANHDNLSPLLQELESRGIRVNQTYRKQKLVGISFDLADEHFSGRAVGKEYSLPQLLKQLQEKRPQQDAISAPRTQSTIHSSTDALQPGTPVTLAATLRATQPEQERIHSDSRKPSQQEVYREKYDVLAQRIRQQLGDDCTQEQIDLQFAILILRSGQPQLKHVLAQSPDIQKRLRDQGEEAAWTYGRELMARAQRWLDDLQQQSQERRAEIERD